jgi:hypothetical protein
MPNPLYVCPSSGNKLYRVGRIGFDVASQDPGSTDFTGELLTERQSPAGETGEVLYRGAVLRVLLSGTYTFVVRFYVDGTQTVDGEGVNQEVTFTATVGQVLGEYLFEAAFRGKGTYLQIEIEVVSSDVGGVFLPESATVFYMPLSAAKRTPTVEVT